MPLKLGFLGSGNGTSFQGLYPLIKDDARFDVRLIISNKENPFLAYAKALKLDYAFISSKNCTRTDFENRLDSALRKHEIEYLFLVGFMRILSPTFVQKWQQKIVNIHPSLLPKHKGLMDLDVHQAVIDKGERLSGCSVHWVTEEVDAGGVIMQKTCEVLQKDSALSLKAKVQALEPLALLDTLEKLNETTIKVRTPCQMTT